jgi:hypothetical protein
MEDKKMIKKKAYRYLGRNGILTSRVLIEGANYIPMVELTAEKNMILTNGNIKTYFITVEEEEIKNWKEIPDDTADKTI